MFRATHATERSLGLLLVGGDEILIDALRSSVLAKTNKPARLDSFFSVSLWVLRVSVVSLTSRFFHHSGTEHHGDTEENQLRKCR